MVFSPREAQYGEIFGGTIQEVIGRGSSGQTVVYKLVQKHSNNYFSALKVVPIIVEYSRKSECSKEYLLDYESLKKEACAAAETEVMIMDLLQGCPHVLSYEHFCFKDWEQEDSFGCNLLIKMPLMESIFKNIREGSFFPEEEIIRIGKDISTALAHCHKASIVHRDIKPENILRNRTGIYFLGDFGISRIQTRAQLTNTGQGTIQFEAPEQARLLDIDHLVDIYSLGLTLYVLANKNRLPFADRYNISSDSVATRRRINKEPLPAPEMCSPGLAKIILRACSPEKEDRYQSASDFFYALSSLGSNGLRMPVSLPTPATREVVQEKQSPSNPIVTEVANAYQLSTEKAESNPVRIRGQLETERADSTVGFAPQETGQNQQPMFSDADGEGFLSEHRTLDATDVSQIGRLAAQGNAAAQCRMGEIYYYGGNGVKPDRGRAVQWWKKSADNGDPIAQYWLGICFYNGIEVKQDKKEALYWTNKSARKGFAEAQITLGRYYYNGEGSESLEERKRLAIYWFKEAEQQNNETSYYWLGICFRDGFGVERNGRMAVEYLTKAATADVPDAIFDLGVMYLSGDSVQCDPFKAIKLFERAAAKGNVAAEYYLGECYFAGFNGITVDRVEAAKWFKKAAVHGAHMAQQRMGDCYLNGFGVERSKTKAIIWYKAAADQGNQDAICELEKLKVDL